MLNYLCPKGVTRGVPHLRDFFVLNCSRLFDIGRFTGSAVLESCEANRCMNTIYRKRSLRKPL